MKSLEKFKKDKTRMKVKIKILRVGVGVGVYLNSYKSCDFGISYENSLIIKCFIT